MNKKMLIINIVLIVVLSFLSIIIAKKLTFKYYSKKECNYSYDARYREVDNGYEIINVISEDGIPIARRIINHHLTDYVYCYDLGITKDNEKIVAPYANNIGCIYTEEVCKLLLDLETKLNNKVDISKCSN